MRHLGATTGMSRPVDKLQLHPGTRTPYPRTALWSHDVLLRSWHCANPSLRHNCNVQHSEGEAKPLSTDTDSWNLFCRSQRRHQPNPAFTGADHRNHGGRHTGPCQDIMVIDDQPTVATPSRTHLARQPDVVELDVLVLEDAQGLLCLIQPPASMGSSARALSHSTSWRTKVEENHEGHHHEMECQRSARQPSLLNSVLGATLEDLHRLTLPRPHGTGMSTICSTFRWTVGTSINCSAFCGRRWSTKRCGILSREILGTSVTCSTDVCVSMSFKISASCSPICGTGISRICTNGQTSTMCSKVCRRTCSCGRGSCNADTGTLSSSSVKNCVPVVTLRAEEAPFAVALRTSRAPLPCASGAPLWPGPYAA